MVARIRNVISHHHHHQEKLDDNNDYNIDDYDDDDEEEDDKDSRKLVKSKINKTKKIFGSLVCAIEKLNCTASSSSNSTVLLSSYDELSLRYPHVAIRKNVRFAPNVVTIPSSRNNHFYIDEVQTLWISSNDIKRMKRTTIEKCHANLKNITYKAAIDHVRSLCSRKNPYTVVDLDDDDDDDDEVRYKHENITDKTYEIAMYFASKGNIRGLEKMILNNTVLSYNKPLFKDMHRIKVLQMQRFFATNPTLSIEDRAYILAMNCCQITQQNTYWARILALADAEFIRKHHDDFIKQQRRLMAI